MLAIVTDSRKKQTNIRLTPTARELLARIADAYGISHGNVIEMLLRAEAARLGLPSRIPSPPLKPTNGLPQE